MSALPEVGQVWVDKRKWWRNVTIVEVVPPKAPDPKWDYSGHEGWVEVRRNTSNRRQAISLRTLARSYRLHSAAGGAS